MGNTRAANIVLEAAKKTTLQDPILRLPEKDSWFIYTTILNEISSMFAIGHVYTDMMSHPKPMFVNKGFIGPAQNLSRAEFHNRISGGIFGVAPPSEQEIQKSLEKVLNAVDSSQEKGNAATGSVNAANNNDTKNNNNNNNNNTTTSSAASSATATATTSQSVLDAASLSTAVHPLSVYSADSELNERYCFTLTREVASEVRFEKIR